MDINISGTSLLNDLKILAESIEEFELLLPWINYISVKQELDNSILVSFTDNSYSKLFSANSRELLAKALQAICDRPIEIIYKNESRGHLVSISPNQTYTFDSFFTGGSNRLAFAASKALCGDASSAYSPLFIYSSTGLGKTHLLHAIANELSKTGKKYIFVSASDFAEQFLKAVENGKRSVFVNEIINTSFLIIDDIENLKISKAAQDELLLVFNMLYSNQTKMIFTSGKSPSEINDIDPALISRFQWGVTVEIENPQPQMRRDVILKHCQKTGIQLSDEIINHLTINTFGPVNELLGVINTMRTRVELLNESPSMSLLSSIIKSSVKNHSNKTSIKDVEDFVCRKYNVDTDNLHSSTRVRSVAYPRQVAMYLAHSMTPSSLEEIGSYFGGRDHSTVKHGCEKIKRLSEKDAALRSIINDFRRVVLSSC